MRGCYVVGMVAMLAVLGAQQARAQVDEVYDNGPDKLTTDTDNIKSDADNIKAYTDTINTSTLILNENKDPGTFAGDDSSQTNPMPSVSASQGTSNCTNAGQAQGDALQQAVSYVGPCLTTSGTTFYNNNNFGLTMGSDVAKDPEAAAEQTQMTTAANIQGMAHDNLLSLQNRLQELSDMNSKLQGAKDITTVEAIRARIEVESLMVQTEQAQASNLAALASAQQEIDKENDAQAIRQEHQTTASGYSSLISSIIPSS